jgi:hypothetical protein
MKVVTGNSESMKDLVCSLLDYYDLEYERDTFLGYIVVKEH